MPNTTEQFFLECLRAAVSGTPTPSVPDEAALFLLAQRHDLAQVPADVLPDVTDGRFRTARYAAVMRYEQQRHELAAVRACFTEAGIAFLPLKGAVLRAWYPQPWWRTGCDIDILVHREELERAVQVLEQELGYRREGAGAHDVSLFSSGGVHLELHFDIAEDSIDERVRAVLADVWTVSAADGYEYRMSDAMFYFYHIAHMAKHIESGGCGVRTFLDLWILRHRVPHDAAARQALLERGGLTRFAAVAEQLCERWFSGAPAEDAAVWLEAFILCGGIYGSGETLAAMQQTRDGGRIRYVWELLFLPYRHLQYQYPILTAHPWLYPVCAVRRLVRLLIGRDRRRAAAQLKSAAGVTREERRAAARLMEALGLSRQ